MFPGRYSTQFPSKLDFPIRSYVVKYGRKLPFRPDEFRDENPLVWEIKSKGIKLL